MKNIAKISLVASALWSVFCYIFIAHLTWLPGYTNTYFIDKGLIYFKDFVQAHLFLPHLFLYPFLKIFDWNIKTDPLIALIVVIFGLFTIYKYAKTILKPVYISFCLFFYTLLVWYASTWIQFSGEMMAGILLLITTFETIKYVQGKSNLSIILIGVLLVLTELTGQIVSFSLLILFVFIAKKMISNKNTALQSFSKLSLGFLIILLPIVLYFVANKAFNDFFYWNVTYYLTYAKLSKTTKTNLPIMEIIAFYTPIIAMLFSQIVKRLKEPEIILTLTVLSGVPLVVFSIFHPHHYLVYLPLLSIMFGLAIQKAKEEKSLSTLAPLTIIIYFAFTSVFPFYANRLNFKKPMVELTDISRDPDQGQMVSWISGNTNLNEKIMVAGDPMFYIRVRRLPANSRYSALPWHYIPLSESRDIILSNLPQYWIVDRDYMKRFYKGWNTPEIAEFIDGTLSKCFTKKLVSGNWEIWGLSNPKNCQL